MCVLVARPSGTVCVLASALSTHTDDYTVVNIDLMDWEIMDAIQTQMLALTGVSASHHIPLWFMSYGSRASADSRLCTLYMLFAPLGTTATLSTCNVLCEF